MKTNPSLVLAGAGLALAAPQYPSHHNTPLLKRTGYEACENDCNLHGVAFPDKHTIQLALENNLSEQCPPMYIGDPNAPTASSRTCLDFVGSDVTFNFEPFPGYTYKNAAVTWGLKGNVLNPSSWNPPPPSNSISCDPNPAGTGLLCKLPFSSLLGVSPTSPIKDLLSGMCPNGDREGQILYLEFSGEVQSTADSSTTTFHSQPPCTARDSAGQCTARDCDTPYFEAVYRCSTCGVAACEPEEPEEPEEPVLTPCSFGTAFGYQNADKSITLDTQSGSGCKRWGWYSTPTLSELQGGSVKGPLYVGAGNNDISKATKVGTWEASASGTTGKVTVTYKLDAPYALGEVHVDLACLPVDKCAPGTYTFNQGGLQDVATYATTALNYPSCSGGSKAALIVHAAVDQLVEGECPK